MSTPINLCTIGLLCDTAISGYETRRACCYRLVDHECTDCPRYKQMTQRTDSGQEQR